MYICLYLIPTDDKNKSRQTFTINRFSGNPLEVGGKAYVYQVKYNDLNKLAILFRDMGEKYDKNNLH